MKNESWMQMLLMKNMHWMKMKLHGKAILYIKVTMFVSLLLSSFIYCLFEVTFFHLFYLSYFLLSP
jgi:hypothetical protein